MISPLLHLRDVQCVLLMYNNIVISQSHLCEQCLVFTSLFWNIGLPQKGKQTILIIHNTQFPAQVKQQRKPYSVAER